MDSPSLFYSKSPIDGGFRAVDDTPKSGNSPVCNTSKLCPRAKLGMQVTSSESARAALDLGADYLVCQGTEAGGHVQATRGLYETLPTVLDETKQKPVIASGGGIGNGQGIRKALLAGAWAAMLGTRFVATIESHPHPGSGAILM